MKIMDIIDIDLINADLNGHDKREVLGELADMVAKKEGLDVNVLVPVLEEREKLGSTGIGDGIAIPHGKLRGLKKLVASFGRSAKGVNFDSIDGKPAHLFFLLMAPENTAGMHLKALARISRLLKDTEFRERLLESRTTQEVYKVLQEEDEKF
ncbi:MAG: PTS sugar transporter subunit IIA [Deltaproteobacteria bacterium]|nr:PTS sugar transporter subunit IIA [Candidatus Zymogenaceae bacterium]